MWARCSATESIGCSIGEERIVLTDSLIPGQAYRFPVKMADVSEWSFYSLLSYVFQYIAMP